MLHYGRETRDFGTAAVCATPWDSNPNRKNEIECCVDRLNPPPLADTRSDAIDVCFQG